LIEFAAIDAGSVNFTQVATTSQVDPARTYLNPEFHVRHTLGIAARHGFRSAFAIYEPGFIRAGAVLARATGGKMPIYRFMLSQQFAFCFPPKPYAVQALATLVEEEAGAAPWIISGLGVDVSPLIGEAVARGGHIRVGLKDALLGTPASATNLGLVESAVEIVRTHGAEPATPDDVRQALGATSEHGYLAGPGGTIFNAGRSWLRIRVMIDQSKLVTSVLIARIPTDGVEHF
jgi:3-keto-5-aminohexanoate cleavage enzyme